MIKVKCARPKNDGFEIRIGVGCDIHGKQIMRSKMWVPDEKLKTDRQIKEALEEAVVKFRMEFKKFSQTADDKVKFETLAEEWLAGANSSLSPITYDTYRQIAPRIYKEFGYCTSGR